MVIICVPVDPGRLNQVSVYTTREGVFYGLKKQKKFVLGQNHSEPVVINHKIVGEAPKAILTK